MEKEKKVYADGVYAKKPSPKAPEFVKGTMSIHVDKFAAFLKEHENDKGYVNFQILDGKEDKLTIIKDSFVAKAKDENLF